MPRYMHAFSGGTAGGRAAYIDTYTGGGTASQATVHTIGTLASKGVHYRNAIFTYKVFTGGSGANPRLACKIQGAPYDDGTPTAANFYTAIACWTGGGGGTSPVGGKLFFTTINSATADWTAGASSVQTRYAEWVPSNIRAHITVTGTAPEWRLCLFMDAEEHRD